MVIITVVAIAITGNRYYNKSPLRLDCAEGDFLCSEGARPAPAAAAVDLAGQSSLSQVVVPEIIGVVLAYAIKSAVENLSKNNRWPDKDDAQEDTPEDRNQAAG